MYCLIIILSIHVLRMSIDALKFQTHSSVTWPWKVEYNEYLLLVSIIIGYW